MTAPSATASVVADLLAQPSPAARAAHLLAEGLADETGLSWLLDRTAELVHDEPDSASVLASLCSDVASKRGLTALSGRSWYLQARVYADRGELTTALELIEQARHSFVTAGELLQALRTDLGRMQILDDLGRHQDAAAVGEHLLERLAADSSLPAGDGLRDWLRAAALENVGVAWSFTGDHDRSLEAYAEAEAMYRQIGSAADVPRPQANRGIELLSIGRAREALEVLSDAAAGFTLNADRLWAAKCLGSVGEAHRQLGDLARALSVLEPAAVVLEEMSAPTELARVRLAIALAWLDIGLFAPALGEAERAIGIYERSAMRHDEAVARSTAASALIGLRRRAEAEDQVRTAATLFEQVGDRLSQARSLVVQSQMAHFDGRDVEAAALATAAARQMRLGGWIGPLAETLLHEVSVAADDVAATALDEAETLVARLDLERLRPRVDLARGLQQRRNRETDQAAASLRKAVAGFERTGSALSDFTFRAAYRADNDAASTELVSLLVDQSGDEVVEAFWLSNRAKSQTLRDLTYRTVGRMTRPASPGSFHALVGERQADLQAAYLALQHSDDPKRRDLLQRRVQDLESDLQALRLRHAATVQQPSGSPAPSSAGPEEVVTSSTLAYHVVGDDLVIFVASQGQISAHRAVGVMPEVDEQLVRLASQWSRFQMGARFAARHEAALLSTANQILARLYSLLIRPVEGKLAELPGDDLLVVPHCQLGAVPFAALRGPTGPLVDRWAIAIGPAVGDEHARRALDKNARALVLAAPDANAPAVAQEAAAVLARLPNATALIGEGATADALMSGAPHAGDLLHVACHGIYCAENPLFSRIRLADRWVTATELLDLDLSDMLVTLSSCESGRHDTSAEPIGLAWALLAAGARGVVVSSWLVHDDTAAQLMDKMYEAISYGVPPAAALRQAQRTIAVDRPHPFFWAPFSYVTRPAKI